MTFKKLVIKILLWVWQFPQNIVGLILSKISNHEKENYNYDDIITVWYNDDVFKCGVSLGNYIILDNTVYNKGVANEKTIRHEHGHQKQSKYLGIFYFIIIGLPSAIGNIIDRIFHKSWAITDRNVWYYNLPWEKWADKLGKVNR